MKKQKAADKIRKLMAHAESAEKLGSEAEAAAFMAQAQRLMAQHKLEMTEVEWEESESDREPEHTYLDPSEWGEKVKKSTVPTWVQRLAKWVARAHQCDSLGVQGSNRLIFIGSTEDVKVTTAVFVHLRGEAERLANNGYSRAYKAGKRTKGFFGSFYDGFVEAIQERVLATERELRDEVGETAMVRLDGQLAKVETYMQRTFNIRTKKSRGRKHHNLDAREQGRRAGKKAELGSSKTKKLS